MSMFEWPEPMLKAVIAEGLESLWKDALELPTAEARNKAKQKILERFTEIDPEDNRLKTIAHLYVEVGPLLAENKAISRAAAKMPQIRNVAPEVLDEQEAVELMKRETLLPEKEWAMILKHEMLRGVEMRSAKNKLFPAWIDYKPPTGKGLPENWIL